MRVVKSLAMDHGILDPKWADDMGLVEVSGNGRLWWEALPMGAKLRMSMGMAWEQWYLQQLPDVLPHTGEMQVDGVYMTPDGESLDLIMSPKVTIFRPAIHEIKLTYKSTNTVGELGEKLRNGLSRNWMVETQAKGYCKGKGCLDAYVHMLFVNGDYSHPFEPQLKIWKLIHEQTEIDESWDHLMNHLTEARTSTE